MLCYVDFYHREITHFTFLLPFLHEQCCFIFWRSNLKTSLRRHRRCNMSATLAIPRYCDHVFFLFGLKFTFLFSEWSECAGVCYITPGSIKPVKSPLYDFPNVNCWEKKKTKKHSALNLVSIQQQWLVPSQDLGFLHFKRCGQMEKKNVFLASWIGVFQISGEWWSVLGRTRNRPPLSG